MGCVGVYSGNGRDNIGDFGTGFVESVAAKCADYAVGEKVAANVECGSTIEKNKVAVRSKYAFCALDCDAALGGGTESGAGFVDEIDVDERLGVDVAGLGEDLGAHAGVGWHRVVLVFILAMLANNEFVVVVEIAVFLVGHGGQFIASSALEVSTGIEIHGMDLFHIEERAVEMYFIASAIDAIPTF